MPRTVVALAIAALLVALAPPPRASAEEADAQRGPDTSLIERLDAERVSYHAETGWVRFVGGSLANPLRSTSGTSSLLPADRLATARAFLGAYGTLFGLTAPEDELRARPVGEPDDGLSGVRFDQVYQGIPVIGGELAVQLDASGAILAVSGEISPDLALDVIPTITPEQAAEAAIAASAEASGLSASELASTAPSLEILDIRLLGGPGLRVPRLVWRTTVSSADEVSVSDFVAIDAQLGGIALRFSDIESALDRRICDRNNVRNDAACAAPYVRVEGGPPSGIADADAAYDHLGEVYSFYQSYLGRDSVDGAGLPLVATVRWCPTSTTSRCPQDNSFWYGDIDQMRFGAGWTTDDIVGHEMTHGLTHFTSKLFYYYQSGAINDAMSDVFGEFVDLTNTPSDPAGDRWLIGEDLAFGILRNMANPPEYLQPDRMKSALYYGETGDSGGVHTNSGVANKAAYLLTDGGSFNGHVVGSIGLAKTAKIFYEANQRLLTSSSDYADLYDDLQQACTALVGTGGITAGDCVQVGEAAAATEMNLQPNTGVPAPDAPMCQAGATPANLFFDDLENGGVNWTPGTIYGSNRWFLGSEYATSEPHHLLGQDSILKTDSYVAMKTGVTVPAGQSYLRFAHAFHLFFHGTSFDHGGVVEYSANGGSWTDALGLFVDNPYNGTVSTDHGNTLAGRQAFVGASYGYTLARLSLASLAGQSVKFRFRLATNMHVMEPAALGWFIDDVRIYTCIVPSAPGAPTGVVATPGNTSAVVTWSAPASTGGSPITGYGVTAAPGGATCSTTGALSCTVSGLANGTPYTFTVRATNANGTGPDSAPSAPVTPATIPGAPTAVSAVGANASALVSWTAPADNGGSPITSYTVTSAPDGRTCATSGTLSCTVSALASGTPYTFTVTATNAVGTGPASAASAPVTPLGPPVPPIASITGLPTWLSTNSIGLRWGATPSTAEATSYDVRYLRAAWNGSFGSYVTWRTATTATSATFPGSPGSTYCFSVRARDALGLVSAWTAATCTAIPLDDRSLTRSGRWTAGSGTAYYRSTYLRSSSSGAKLTRTGVVAKRIAIVATTCPTCGSVRVYWGSTLLRTISLRSATTVNKKLITVTTFTSARKGTLMIKVYSSGKKVLIDGVAIRRN